LSETYLPNESTPAYVCAFLCDTDGRVIRDLVEETPRSAETISARSLMSLVESGSWIDFLEAVRIDGTALGWGIRIPRGVPISNLLLNGLQTPFGILVFAASILRPSKFPEVRSARSATAPGFKAGRAIEDLPNLLPNAVHDLRNSISSVLSLCEYFGEYSQKNQNPDYMEMIASVESSARTALELSDRMFELSRRIGFWTSQQKESVPAKRR